MNLQHMCEGYGQYLSCECVSMSVTTVSAMYIICKCQCRVIRFLMAFQLYTEHASFSSFGVICLPSTLDKDEHQLQDIKCVAPATAAIKLLLTNCTKLYRPLIKPEHEVTSIFYI